MSVFETLSPAQPNAQQGAQRIKRVLAQAFQQTEVALMQVRGIIDRHDPAAIRSELGQDRAEVVSLYGALKTFVEQHKPGASVPDLPDLESSPKR